MPGQSSTTCVKQSYPDQETARTALARIREKQAAKRPSSELPVRVYPCDRCLGWHTTAKRQKGKSAWDRDPRWQRPAEEVARIEALLRADLRA